MLIDGFRFHPGLLGRAAQAALVRDVMTVIAAAPLYVPTLPATGKAMSVRMTNCGPLGWFTDRAGGYRYVERHPETGRKWPAMPESVRAVWRTVAGYDSPPEACLVNFYGETARMGLHRDADEAATDAPVVSISLGDDALFRMGGARRSDATRSMWLRSGDVVVLAGAARHAYHGVDRVRAGSSRLIPDGGRLNLTLRRVTCP